MMTSHTYLPPVRIIHQKHGFIHRIKKKSLQQIFNLWFMIFIQNPFLVVVNRFLQQKSSKFSILFILHTFIYYVCIYFTWNQNVLCRYHIFSVHRGQWMLTSFSEKSFLLQIAFLSLIGVAFQGHWPLPQLI